MNDIYPGWPDPNPVTSQLQFWQIFFPTSQGGAAQPRRSVASQLQILFPTSQGGAAQPRRRHSGGLLSARTKFFSNQRPREEPRNLGILGGFCPPELKPCKTQGPLVNDGEKDMNAEETNEGAEMPGETGFM